MRRETSVQRRRRHGMRSTALPALAGLVICSLCAWGASRFGDAMLTVRSPASAHALAVVGGAGYGVPAGIAGLRPARAEERIAEPSASVTVALPTVRAARPVAVWRGLLLIYHNTEADYVGDGVLRHLSASMPSAGVSGMATAFVRHMSDAYEFSGGEAVILYDTVHVSRPVASVTSYGGAYWLTPDDIRADLDTYAPPGSYDSIEVAWMNCSSDGAQCIPLIGFGAATPRADWSNGATFASIGYFYDWVWATGSPDAEQCWLHEWLHGVCSFYRERGYAMPDGDADGGDSHGYHHSTADGYASYYRDLMTGRVWEPDLGAFAGITPTAWRSGTILGQRSLVQIDHFSRDTVSDYRAEGVAAWEGDRGTIRLGAAAEGDNRLYTPLAYECEYEVSARVQVPASGAGPWDSVAIGLRDERVEYWAILGYGTGLSQAGTIAIARNEAWDVAHPLSFTAGWYTIEAAVDYDSLTLRAKAWRDGDEEPDWQVASPLDPGWRASEGGYRHYGRGITVDDLVIIAPLTCDRDNTYLPLVSGSG